MHFTSGRDFIVEARDNLQRIPDDKRVIYSLVAANVVVHLMWKLPSLARFMTTNFVQVRTLCMAHLC